MKTQFRKTTAWLLTLAMLFTMLPGFTLTASAASFTSLTVGGVDALTTSSGTGWSYDANSSTLTITGNIGNDSGTLAINAVTAANSQDVLNITVTNNANITGGIYAGGKLNLVVNSGVTLTVNSSGDNHAIASGYHGVQDSVKITGGGTVVAISSSYGDGIKSGGGLWIEGVTVAAQGRNYGLDSGSGRLYIKDNSKVYAVSSQDTAIVAPSSAGHDVVEISGENTVVVAGFALGSAANNYVPTIDTPSNSSIRTGTLKVNCGHLIIGDGLSLSSFDTGRMVLVSHSNYAEYVGHLTNYQQNSDGTHTPKCIDGCPVPTTGTVEDCSGTTYCNGTVCDKCGQTSGTGDGTSHKEGTAATCTTLAVCEICTQTYGELDPTNHTGSATGNYTYVDGTYHSAIFDCCNVVGGAKQEHESTDGDITCDICNNLMLAKVLAEIAAAPSGTTLNYSGNVGSDAYPDSTSQVIMTIPEGVTVNWDVDAVVNMSPDGNIRYYPLSLSGGGTLNLTGSIKNQGSSPSVTLASDSTVTLVVKDGGAVECEGGAAIVANGGKVIVEGGTVSGASTYDSSAIALYNYADVTITGGTVTAGYYVIHHGGSGKVAVSGEAHIQGTFADDNFGAGIRIERTGTVEVSGSPTITHTNGRGIFAGEDDAIIIFRAGTTASVTGDVYGIYNGHVAYEVGANPTITGNTANTSSVTTCSGGAATCKSGPICSTCGITYGAADANAHTGGTATCASGAVCTECGITYGQPDATQHVWGYTVSGATITVSCSANCGYTGTATISATGKPYDGTAVTASVEKTGALTSETIDIAYAVKDGEALTEAPMNAGTYTASITYEGVTASVDFTITPVTITADMITVAEEIYNGERQLPDEIVTVGGVVLERNADYSVQVWSDDNYYRDAGEWEFFIRMDMNPNYTGDSIRLTQIIEKAPLTVSGVTATGRSYDGTNTVAVTEVALAGKIGSDDVSVDVTSLTGTLSGSVVGTYTTIELPTMTLTGNHKDNYSLTQPTKAVSTNVTITKAPLTVTADNKTMTTGQALPTLTYTVTGFVNGETESVLTKQPTISCEADGTTEGTYDITVSGAEANNYTFTYVNGTLSVVDHEHAWTYTLSGTDTITATCGNADTCPVKTATIKIAAEGKIYDGTPVTATLTGSIDGVTTPPISYTGNTNAGTYTASITIEGVTAKAEFTIEKALPTVAWDSTTTSVNYTGSAAVITAPTVTLVNGESFGGTISYSYTGTSSGNGLPINAGTYEITASIAAQGNYTAATSINTLTLTINKASAPAIVWPTASSLVYGQKLSASTLTSNDSNGTFAWQDSNIVPTVANSGYVVVYTPKDTNNYDYNNVTLEHTIPVNVTTADQADFSISGANSATYGDSAITLNAAGGSGTGAITWKITSGDAYAEISGNGTTATLTIKGAGTVVVEATKASDGNYNAKVDTHTIVIGKATVDASDFTYTAPSDLVYSKTAKESTVTGDSAYGAITIKYYSDSSLTTIVDPINVGTYYVGITTAGGDNYEALPKTLVGSFTITARPVTVTAAAQSRKYGEDNPTLTYTHNLIDGDSFSGALTTTATKTSDVGEYNITIGDLANSNYSISFTGAKLTITKADGPAAPTVTGSYKDNGMTYTYTVDVIEGAEYSKDGTTWQDSNVFENLVAGQKYTFYARIKETKNYNPGAVGTSAEVDLSKLPGVGTVTIGDWTYGENAQAPVTDSTTGNAVENYLYESTDDKGYSSENVPTNAGEYKLTVTFAATATHNGTTASDTFTIKKATPVVDAPTGLTATYGDTLADVQLETGWAWKDAGTTEVGNAGENTFTVIYTHPTDAANHEQVEKTVTIAVIPKIVTAIVNVVGENFIFNGSEQKPGVTVKDGETEITIPESEYTVAYTDNTNAGTATVTITDKDGGNYTVTGTTTFAIAKKASSALSGVEREFLRTIATTGNEIDVEAMLPDNHGTVTYTITSSGYTVLENVAVDANGKLVFDTKTSAAAASDTITVKVEMQNYTDVILTVSVILNDKAPQEITGVSAATGLIYNGKAQQGYTGTPTSDYTGAYEITYTGRDNTYNSSVAPTNAGDYTVTFKIPDSDLYYSGNVSVNFTIGKAQATVTADDKEVYIGNRMPELTYKVSGLIGDDTISVELSCDANMNRAGETPIVVSATDPNGNYEITTVNGTLTVKYYPYIPIITPTYPPVVDGGDNGDVVVTPKNPEKGDTVTITPDPDAGYEVDEIIVTDKNGNPIPVIDNGDGTYSFKQPSGKVTITVTFAEIDATCPGDKTCPMYGYTDLDRTAWYHDGVHFCIENDLMNGTGTNTFAPGMTTSRAMIVTILWRLEGEPTVNVGTDFSDVENGKWYSEAIKWAAANNIVNGYGNGLFGPDDVITREQLATILYRYEQYKGGGFKGMWMFRMDYVDLADVSDWAYEAMCWMNMNGIVNGKPGKVLDPKGSATRAEAATILYRYCEVMTKEEEN